MQTEQHNFQSFGSRLDAAKSVAYSCHLAGIRNGLSRRFRLFTVCTLAVVIMGCTLWASESAQAETKAERIQIGKEIAFRNKGKTGVGNCIACHVIVGSESPGDMGPPLVLIQQRFPQRDMLRSRIYDATQFNPISAMPPFGKHGILTESEIEYVIDFLHTL